MPRNNNLIRACFAHEEESNRVFGQFQCAVVRLKFVKFLDAEKPVSIQVPPSMW